MKRSVQFIVLLSLVCGLGLTATCAATRTVEPLPGQSSTLLPDGRYLLLGGERSGTPVSAASIFDPRSGATSSLPGGLVQARAWHTATLLANGTVLVFGGIGETGQVTEAAEIFDPASDSSLTLSSLKIEPRAFHTATLLTDGRVLIAGGRSQTGQVLDSIALWDYRANSVTEQAGTLFAAREKHTATLLPDGSVLLQGGVDAGGMGLDFGERFDPVLDRTTLQRWPSTLDEPGLSLQLEASLPPDGAGDVLPDAIIALRFSVALNVITVNTETVTLVGPEGPVPAKVVPAERGMLVFVSPKTALLPATTYTVSMAGLSDGRNRMPNTTISFTMAGSPSVVAEPVSGIADLEANVSGDMNSSWRNLPALQAATGVTALSGQVLRLNGLPLANVTLSIAGHSVTSDESGRFLLSPLTAGHQVLLIDGGTASASTASYGVFEVGVELVSGKTNKLHYTIWMPKLDTAHAVTIPSPTTKETVITNPRLPGLELHLPPSTVVYDHNWQVVSQVGVTPIPLAQPPFPLPKGVSVPIYFTIQPGAGYLEVQDPKQPQGGWLVYPNTYHSPVGTRYDFWNYDIDHGWYVYGHGTVAANGKQVVPDPGVLIYQLTGAMVASPSFAPSSGPAAGSCGGTDGDPVDCGTGLLVLSKTDLLLPDVIPINLTRTYRQMDHQSRAFGIGTTHIYDMFLVGDTNPWTYADLILPDGGRIHYHRISPGTSFTNAVYLHDSSPTIFYGSTLSFVDALNSWYLRLKDGTVLVFPDGAGSQTYQQGALLGIVDRHGNKVQLTRDENSNLTSVTSPNGRWIQFTYDLSSRVTQATDNAGRTLTYTYDSKGHLSTVTDPAGGITTYTYDNFNNLLSVTDARGILYLQNQYDSNNRVMSQTLADGGVYQFAYTLNSSGDVTQTQVTNPRGIVRDITFNSNGYVLTDIHASGRPEQQTTTLQWQANSNLLLGSTDALGRTTSFDYDASGDMTQLTQLAGTASAAVTSFTYEPLFHQITSITDPLNHTSTFAYDVSGNPVENIDPLGHKWTFAYNGAGQPQSITDALGDTTNFSYLAGDFGGFTDPLGHTFSRIVNGAGQLISSSDALGNPTQYSYSPLSEITKIVDALGSPTKLSYDADGDVLTITDPRNHVNSYAYDNADQLISHTDPLSRTEGYQYDSRGNLTQFTDRRGITTTLTYDGLNRVVSKAFAQGGTTTSTVTFTYDAGNRMTQLVDSRSGTITHGYDGLDDLTSETTPQGTVTYTYDQARRRTSMTVSGQSPVNYTYDNDNRLTGVTQGGATVVLSYDALGRRTSLTLPNGVVGSYSYDQASRLTALAYANGSTAVGNLSYTYDADNRQTGVGGTLASLVLPATVASATYDAANELTKWGTVKLTYDANGNLASDGTNSYTWNDRNQLAQIADAGVTAATFQYDSLGRRVVSSTGGPATSYLYDLFNVVQQQATTNANLLTGLAPDEIFSRTDASGTGSFLTDALNSTVALTDSTAAVQTAYSYAPFGDTSSNGAASTNPFQFTGRENDGTGLYYYRARYYSPRYSRFISEDPLGSGYVYAGNSPTNLRDPSGLVAGWFGPGFPATPENIALLQEALTKDLSGVNPLAQTAPAVNPLASTGGAIGAGGPSTGSALAAEAEASVGSSAVESGFGSNIAGQGLEISQFQAQLDAAAAAQAEAQAAAAAGNAGAETGLVTAETATGAAGGSAALTAAGVALGIALAALGYFIAAQQFAAANCAFH